MVINSDVLKEKLKYLSFGISKNSTDPIRTKAIRFDTINNNVYAYTCDTINNVKVAIGSTTKDFNAMTDFAQFANLIKSCEGDITLEADSKFIKVKTNIMKAKLPVYPSSGTGGIPDPSTNITCDHELKNDFRLGLLKLVIDTSHIIEAYRKVYFGDTIMVSDTDNVLVIKDRIFDKDIMLDYSSVELLSNITDVKYTYFTASDKTKKLYVISKELEASIIISSNDSNEFQYTDLMDLFTSITGSSVEIDSKILSKAVATSKLFKNDPNMVFNNDGIFLTIDSSDFSYKVSDAKCDDRAFVLTSEVAKKICFIGETVTVYYSNDDLIRCDCDDVSEILSVVEVNKNG